MGGNEIDERGVGQADVSKEGILAIGPGGSATSKFELENGRGMQNGNGEEGSITFPTYLVD